MGPTLSPRQLADEIANARHRVAYWRERTRYEIGMVRDLVQRHPDDRDVLCGDVYEAVRAYRRAKDRLRILTTSPEFRAQRAA